MSGQDLDKLLAETSELDAAATPGPWEWFGNMKMRDVDLATVDRGRRFVMQFARWGMSGAQPRFQVQIAGGGGIMRSLDQLEGDLGPRMAASHRKEFVGIGHPDARFIARARALLPALAAAAAATRMRLMEERDAALCRAEQAELARAGCQARYEQAELRWEHACRRAEQAEAEVERLRALWEFDPTAAAIRARDEAIAEGRRAIARAEAAEAFANDAASERDRLAKRVYEQREEIVALKDRAEQAERDFEEARAGRAELIEHGLVLEQERADAKQAIAESIAQLVDERARYRQGEADGHAGSHFGAFNAVAAEALRDIARVVREWGQQR